MSRIQEAIRKAAREHQLEPSNDYTTAESILEVGQAAAASRATRTGPLRPQEPIEMPKETLVDWHPNDRQMFFNAEDGDPVAREQFRSLRMTLSELRAQSGVRVIMVGSALPGDGKTFVATNLAQAFAAQRDSRVLLIDCDIRHGSVAEVFGARKSPGLSEYLLGEKSLQDVLQRGVNSRISLISSGRYMAEPGELVADSKMQTLIQHMRQSFDWIVIDTPPVIQFSDASVLAGVCDGTLLVLKAGTTPVRMAQRAAELFKGRNLLGAVLNCADTASSLGPYYVDYYRPQLEKD